MNTSASSVILTFFLWYILLGVYNLAFFSFLKKLKGINWQRFLLETLGLLGVYILVNILSIQFGSGTGIMAFSILNLVLVAASAYGYSRYVMKLKDNDPIIYSVAFVVVFNLYWYVLAGII